jgi:glutaminyl-tRNA synthetase
MATQKEINKYVKEKDSTAAKIIIQPIIENIKSIDNFSLLVQTITKNIKNDNNSLLFSNLILNYSNNVHSKDIEQESLSKLYAMSLKSQLAAVRILAIQNLKNDAKNWSDFQTQLAELKNSEKNEQVLELLKTI